MKSNIITILCLVGLVYPTFAQYNQTFKVTDNETSKPIPGVVGGIPQTNIGGLSTANGVIGMNKIPEGTHTFTFNCTGYKELKKEMSIPSGKDTIYIKLTPLEHQMNEIVIEITRTGRSIEDIPTRVEIIGGEELGEKAVMNSSNISMFLKESTGIQVQQTSATSGNKSIRIQGLDGRYTQMVKDGFPLFGGFSGGLSIMQIPPLDLERVEVIKGSSSTLYGGGAIAGVVNLISKKPSSDRNIELMVDQTSALKTTINTFYSQQKGKLGWTLYNSANYQKVYDVDGDHFSELPLTKGLSINPSLFFYPDESSDLRLTINTIFEDRTGGDIRAVEGSPDSDHTYYEQTNTNRYSYQLTYNKWFSNEGHLNIKNSLASYNRSVNVPNYEFSGTQVLGFSEVSYSKLKDNSEWLIGGNLYTDSFNETSSSDSLQRDYNNETAGLFAQYNKDLGTSFVLEAGLRGDYNLNFDGFLLPRVSLLYKISDHVSSRIGGGYGYKIPTIFMEDTERRNYEGVNPIDNSATEAEQSKGMNFDVNFKKKWDNGIGISFNQLFFLTELQNALLLNEVNTGSYSLANSQSVLVTRGFESNLKLTYKHFKLFTNYAFISAIQAGNQKAITPKHNIGTVLVYEEEDKWRIGYELYFTGGQYLSDMTKTNDYLEMGLMIMRTWEKMSLYINFENFTDTRQSQYETVSIPPHNNPGFRQIWAPTEGRIINGGIILRL